MIILYECYMNQKNHRVIFYYFRYNFCGKKLNYVVNFFLNKNNKKLENKIVPIYIKILIDNRPFGNK